MTFPGDDLAHFHSVMLELIRARLGVEPGQRMELDDLEAERISEELINDLPALAEAWWQENKVWILAGQVAEVARNFHWDELKVEAMLEEMLTDIEHPER
jgi:hypothetical protein